MKNGVYAEPALVPESPWLGREMHAKPEAKALKTGGGIAVDFKLPSQKKPWQWLIRVQTDKGWETFILPGIESRLEMSLQEGAQAKAVTVAGVSRLSRVGRATRVEIQGRDCAAPFSRPQPLVVGAEPLFCPRRAVCRRDDGGRHHV
jgi:hypothetical protein